MPTPILHMVTTTNVPYMYHVPVILGLPSGTPYWFRYLRQYLHPSLITLAEDQIPQNGILCFRDDKSQQKLCFPIRRFKVLSFDRSPAVCFLNLRMEGRVRYGPAPLPPEVVADDPPPALTAPDGLDQESWNLLTAHVRHYVRTPNPALAANEPPAAAPNGVDADNWRAFRRFDANRRVHLRHTTPRTIAVPRANESAIVPWANLRPVNNDNFLLWIADGPDPAPRGWRILEFFRRPPYAEEHEQWKSMLPAFAAMEYVNRTPFFLLHEPVAITRKYPARPTQIGDGRGMYAYGFPGKVSQTFRLRVDEVAPHAFCQDVPATPAFKLTIENSDSAIRPAVKNVPIDGAYGYYEFSYDLDAARVGTYALLRLSTAGLALPASETGEGALELPDMVVAIAIRRQWLRNILWGFLAFAFILAFVSASIWLVDFGVEDKSAASTLAQAFLFGLALYCANKAGLKDFASNVGKKV